MESYPPHRVEGTAVFMASDPAAVPHALLHNLKHNKVLHQTVVFFTIRTEEVPRVPDAERIEFTDLGFGCYRVIAHLGFLEQPDAEALLTGCSKIGLDFEPMLTSYFLSRDAIVPTALPGMAMWREHLFAWMVKNATRAATDFSRFRRTAWSELAPKSKILMPARLTRSADDPLKCSACAAPLYQSRPTPPRISGRRALDDNGHMMRFAKAKVW